MTLTPSFYGSDESGWDACLDGVDAACVSYAPDLAMPGTADAVEAFVEHAKARRWHYVRTAWARRHHGSGSDTLGRGRVAHPVTPFPHPTNMRPLTLIAALALLASPVSAQETVRLSFDWPAGLSGTVTTTSSQTSGTMGMSMSQGYVISQRIETEDHPEGLLIRYRDGELVEMTNNLPTGTAGAEGFLGATAEAGYDMIVADDGSLVRVERDSASMANLRAAMEEMIGPAGEAGEVAGGMAGMLEGMLSDDALNAQVEGSWAQMAGPWIRDDFTLGEAVTSREEAPFPLMQNRSLLMDKATTVRERVPCVEGGPADQCVLVVVETSIDPEDMRQMMDEMFAQMLGGMSADMDLEIGLDAFEQTMVTETILDPNTMLPYSSTFTTAADMEMTVMGQTMPTRQEMSVTMEYAWESR